MMLVGIGDEPGLQVEYDVQTVSKQIGIHVGFDHTQTVSIPVVDSLYKQSD